MVVQIAASGQRPVNETKITESLKNFDVLPDSAHVPVRTVAAVLGVSESTVWRMVRRGRLPAPERVSERATRWQLGKLREAIVA